MPADSTIGEVFNDHGKTLREQTQAMAQEQGKNAEFAEFVPVRYAWQRVAGVMFYVKVRVGEGQFADVQIYSSWDESVRPVIHSTTLRVAEDAPISGTGGGFDAVGPPQHAQVEGCPGCRSNETRADAVVAGLFHEHAREFLRQSVSLAQARGQNAEFTELTPVCYAWQRVAGKMYFVKARVAESAFADLRIYQSYLIGMAPEVTGLVLGVGKETPISDFTTATVVV